MQNIKLSCFILCPHKGVKNTDEMQRKKKKLMMQWQYKNLEVELKEHFQSMKNNHCQVSNTWRWQPIAFTTHLSPAAADKPTKA